MNLIVSSVLLMACFASSVAAQVAEPDPARHVNPFIGTDGTGHVFPGASRPFGMVAPSPDNAGRGWSYSAGYQFRAPTLLGFSNTHISGAGIPELGDVLLMPAQGTRFTQSSKDFAAHIDKASESASPGYYRVRLPGHGVTVELTATQRVALHRYRFDRTGKVQVLVDLQHGLVFGDAPRVLRCEASVDAASGHISGTVHTQGWVQRQASFVLRFDHAIASVQTLPAQPGDKAPRYLLDFDLGPDSELHARVALSTVDEAGARRNLAVDDGKTFDTVRVEARAEWNSLLSRIQIQAPEQQQRIFYSALYRTLLHPSDIADVDGRVRGPTGQVQRAESGRYYSTLSLWDTFRAVHPLLTLLVPERVDGFVQTLLSHHQAQGYLPLWTAWGRETHTMIGNPALPVIADAVAKGFKGFDRVDALQAMVETSTAPRHQAPPWAQQGWSDYDELGYVPLDRVSNEAVSQTLEYGIGDDAVARVARAVGRADLAKRFAQRAQGYRKLWDASTQMMRGKDSQGRWRTPFDPLAATSPMNNPGDYTEANAWQYTLTPALHDPQGLLQLMGGKKALEDWLDRFFSVQAPGDNKHLGQEALIGQYAHGNEPSHHVAYLYKYTDTPAKSDALIRRVARDFYNDQPSGIAGNDDCGQMSAWYVLSTLGFYPVVPASGSYVLGVPLVVSATLQLAGGKTLHIRAARPRVSATRAQLNGRAVDARALPHQDLVQGGVLQF